MLDTNDVQSVIGRTVVDSDGDKIGTAGQVFLDDQTGQPEWVTVSTGLFGTRESFVPLARADVRGDDLVVPYSKDQVKDAPNVDVDGGHLSVEEEEQLFRHYGVDHAGRGTDTDTSDADISTDRYTTTTDAHTVGTYAAATDTVGRGGVGEDTSGPETDEAMTRSEEQLRVGTERVQTGQARLRKWVETEQVDVPVTVTREKARLVTEPVTDANRDDALSGADITEEEHEVTLTEERPVVAKETVPVERVRLETETVQDETTVSEQVRKERIETEGDIDSTTDRR